MDGSRPHVAICLATYEADEAALLRQVDSLRSQSAQDWHCWVVDDGSSERGVRVVRSVVADDARFTVVAMPNNVGFYRNFERALETVRGRSAWVALCDQDDEWWPDKLSSLLHVAESSTSPCLAFGDVEIRTDGGRLVSPTYWQGRSRDESDLAALLFANTVSGAACLFSNDLLESALPFPSAFPSSFHDHWLALVARTAGCIRYVDRPLQVYVQHERNAIGHQPRQGRSVPASLRRLLGRRFWQRPPVRYYDDEVARLADVSRTLLARSSTALSPDDRDVLQHVAALHGGRPPVRWMVGQALSEARDARLTMNRRRRVLASVLWTHVEARRGSARP